MKLSYRGTLAILFLLVLALSAQVSGYAVASSISTTPPSKESSQPLPENSNPAQSSPTLGVVKVLMIAVAFSDVKPTMTISELRKEWFGTVVNYYNEISYGKLRIQGDMYGWYTLPYTHMRYGRDCKGINDPDCSGTNQSWKIANDTIPLVLKDVNFANYDYYVFIHSGAGQETSGVKNDIWSVTYFNASVSTPSKTLTSFSIVPETEEPPNVANGDWCVEFAHLLGIPDLYDTSNGPNNGKTILGPWDLMDKGSWNGDPPGSLPAHMTAWAKIQLGFINGPLLMTAPAGLSTFTIDPTETASNNVHAVKVPIAGLTSNQYYLIEVRQQIGFDAALPASGVLITYVDEGKSVGKVHLINADPGVADLSNAAWQTGQTFTDSSHTLSIAITSVSGKSYEVTVTRPLASPSPSLEQTGGGNSTTRIVVAGTILVVELATTTQEQEKGLSGRSSLLNDHGMLFVFGHEDYWSFWMPDMNFPLDIIWFNAAHQVVWTEVDVQPCQSVAQCPTLTPEGQAMYVLEVNAGFITSHHIQMGTTFSFLPG